jgi:hypothetical protein
MHYNYFIFSSNNHQADRAEGKGAEGLMGRTELQTGAVQVTASLSCWYTFHIRDYPYTRNTVDIISGREKTERDKGGNMESRKE